MSSGQCPKLCEQSEVLLPGLALEMGGGAPTPRGSREVELLGSDQDASGMSLLRGVRLSEDSRVGPRTLWRDL